MPSVRLKFHRPPMHGKSRFARERERFKYFPFGQIERRKAMPIEMP